MRRKNEKTGIYGMEEYVAHSLYPGWLFSTDDLANAFYLYRVTVFTCCLPLDTSSRKEVFQQTKNLFSVIESNKEILKDAKTIYVHPCCKVPRTVLFQKYKKVLNPWLADVIVVPKTSPGYSHPAMLLSNEDVKGTLELDVDMLSGDIKNYLSTIKIGTRLRDIIEPYCPFSVLIQYHSPETLNEILSYELQYYGPAVYIDSKDKWLLDCADGVIPRSKLVFEEDALKALKGESNKPDCESLVSLCEMLGSSDDASNDAALKAIAAMDYINYPNSFIYIFRHANSRDWRYSKMWSNTDVKYMTEILGIRNPRYMGYKGPYISKDDYELFIQVFDRLRWSNERLDGLPFMYSDQKLEVHPRIKD